MGAILHQQVQTPRRACGSQPRFPLFSARPPWAPCTDGGAGAERQWAEVMNWDVDLNIDTPVEACPQNGELTAGDNDHFLPRGGGISKNTQTPRGVVRGELLWPLDQPLHWTGFLKVTATSCGRCSAGRWGGHRSNGLAKEGQPQGEKAGRERVQVHHQLESFPSRANTGFRIWTMGPGSIPSLKGPTAGHVGGVWPPVHYTGWSGRGPQGLGHQKETGTPAHSRRWARAGGAFLAGETQCEGAATLSGPRQRPVEQWT